MSYAHDFGHDVMPDMDDPFWENEDDVLEVFGKECNRCGTNKLQWFDTNGWDGTWQDSPRWRLCDMNGRIHVCPRTNTYSKPVTTPAPEDHWWEHLEERLYVR